ncbi:MAG TPA: TlpA disulfide reductase family protein [Alloacidobacterium sp.]|nr:TlpA disulfide reductase family protein [Alloacidobacterium sp.]
MKALTCALLILCCVFYVENAHAKRAPNLELRDLQGHSQKLASLRGQIVVLNFWATWCGPCREELPRLSKLAQSYNGMNVRFIAVSIDAAKDRAKIQPALDRGHVTLENWVGASTDTLGSFGLGDIVPGTVILDERGEIIARIMGEARDEDVRTAVDWLLSDRSGPPPAAVTKRY